MKKSILLTYITSSKSSWEIAEIMAKEMEQQGAKVDIIPVREVDSMDDYQMVVLGAPIYSFIWPKYLHRFLSKHSEILKTLPVAVFTIVIASKDVEAEQEKAHKQVNKALAKFNWLKPIALELFSIKLPASAPFPFNLFKKQQTPTDEIIDWNAIKAWARGLVKA